MFYLKIKSLVFFDFKEYFKKDNFVINSKETIVINYYNGFRKS